MKTYQSHKQVKAGKITYMEQKLPNFGTPQSQEAIRQQELRLAVTKPIPHEVKASMLPVGRDPHFLILGEIGEYVIVDHSWVERHRPEVGGYFVQYKDGYTSFSPVKAFEEGHTLVADNRSAGVSEVGRHKIIGLPPQEDWTLQRVLIKIEGDKTAFGFTQEIAVVGNEWMVQHKPKLGGYLINYVDGAIGYADPIENLPAKVTIEALEAKIKNVAYEVRPDGRTTICEITMANGFTLRGESSCAVAAEFNAALGEKYAYKYALDKAWAFEGYLLMEKRAGLS